MGKKVKAQFVSVSLIILIGSFILRSILGAFIAKICEPYVNWITNKIKNIGKKDQTKETNSSNL